MSTTKQVTLTIDGVPTTVPEGTLLVEAAKRVRTDIPVYCYHSKLGPAGLCRVCLVEVEKTPKLQIACNTTVSEGMVVRTQGPKVEEGRRAVLEFLLLNHPLDCPICDKGGECDLQDFSIAYGQGASRKVEKKDAKPKAVDLGPTIVLDEERCIVCQRCVRFDDIITAERTLVVKERGHNDVIASATGAPYRSDFSGNVTELCPVGALTSKTYRFASRPWDLRRTLTACSQCSVGCGMHVDVRHGTVLRTMSAEDDARSDGWLCDRGRYNIGFLGEERRITSPMLRIGREWAQISWDKAITLWASKIKEAIAADGVRSVAAIGGGRLLNEEAYLLQHVFRALGVQNLDWRAGRQRLADMPGFEGTFADLEQAQAVVVLGVSPAQTAPVMDLRIRKAVRRGAKLFRVGDHASTAFTFESHASSVAALGEEAFAVERLAVAWDGVDQTLLADFAKRVAPFVERGTLRVFGYVAGEQANARGAQAVGMTPRGDGFDARGIFDCARNGMLRVLSLFGVNPLLRYADGAFAREAIEKTGFVTVSELFMTQTAQRADLVLPARSSFEKDGHMMNMIGEIVQVHAALPAPSETLSDGDMLVALAAELGVELPAPAELRAIACAPPSSFVSVRADGQAPASRGETGAGSLRVAVTTSPFSGGGTIAFDERLASLRAKPVVTVSARSAQKHGVRDGDAVDVVAGTRALRGLLVRVHASAPDDTATILDGLPEAPANMFSSGESVTLENPRTASVERAEARV